MTRGLGTIGAVITAVVLAARAIGVAAEEARDFDRYKVIIERSPFFPSKDAAGAPQPSFATRYVLVGMFSSTEDNRPRAMIQDTMEQNKPVCFKAEGETIDNTTVKVVKIDQSSDKLVLQQGLEVATLSYQSRAGGPPPTPVPGVAQPMPGAPAPATAAPGSVLPVRTQPAPRRIPFRRGGTE